jgi:hypothetical protein
LQSEKAVVLSSSILIIPFEKLSWETKKQLKGIGFSFKTFHLGKSEKLQSFRNES